MYTAEVIAAKLHHVSAWQRKKSMLLASALTTSSRIWVLKGYLEVATLDLWVDCGRFAGAGRIT